MSLLIIAALALMIMRQVRSARDDVQRLMRGGTRVMATITDIQLKQDWKEGERWEHSPWDGRLVRQKTWQIYYEVTAQWLHPQTKQSCTFHSKVWSDEVAKMPTAGDAIAIIVDLHHPQCHALVQSLASEEQ